MNRVTVGLLPSAVSGSWMAGLVGSAGHDAGVSSTSLRWLRKSGVVAGCRDGPVHGLRTAVPISSGNVKAGVDDTKEKRQTSDLPEHDRA